MAGAGAMETFGAVAVSASVRINAVSDFHQPLAAQGTWVEVGTYGSCWRPAHVAVGWQPYVSGSWAWTDYGWYWESTEPWGWACYHYGNWVFDPGFGWIWIPGIEWSPAWVSWRTGGGYWGWAPLPPRGVVIAPRAYVFVEGRHFHEPIRPNTVIVNNTTIVNKTTEIKNVRREVNAASGAPAARVVVNGGPKREDIEKATGTKIRQLAAHDIPRPTRNAAPTKSSGTETPSKPVPPEKPVPPGKPVPPEKPAPPDKPTPPDRPTPPEKPQPVPPAPVPPEKPLPPDPPVPPEKPAPVPRPNPPGLDRPSPEKPARPGKPPKQHERGAKPDHNKD